MNFITNDKAYITDLKNRIISTSDNPESWRCVFNQLYLQDMINYFKSISSTIVYPGMGSFIPKHVIVVDDLISSIAKDITKLLIINNLGLDIIRIVPFLKTNDTEGLSAFDQMKYTIMELNLLAPSYIHIFSALKTTFPELKIEAHILYHDINNFDKLIEGINVAK